MDLLNQNYNAKPERSKGSKIVITLLIVCIILVVLVLALMIYLQSTQEQKKTIEINGIQLEVVQNFMISDNLGNNYISLKDLSDALGYKYNNGAFGEYEEDRTKCYIDNGTEIVGFSQDSSAIYKTTEKSQIDYEYYKLAHNILTYQDKLYIAVDDLKIALNLIYDGSNANKIAIKTIQNVVATHTEALKQTSYTLITDNNNLKTIAYGMLVTNRDGLLGVLNTNYQEIIGNKYKTMQFDEYTMSFIVSSERNQYGIITTDGSVDVALKYDSLKVISHEPLLYEVSKDKKYGIMKKDGTMLTDIEYDRIGYPEDAANKINYTLIIPDLDGKTGRTVVVYKDGKYGLIYLSNGKTFIECSVNRIYEVEELGEIKYRVQVDENTYELSDYIEYVRTQTMVVN